MKFSPIGVMLLITILLSGCNTQSSPIKDKINQIEQSPDSTQYPSETIEPLNKVDLVYTTEKKLSLTFNGLPEREKVTEVLRLLDQYHIVATFFVTGQRVAVEPELVELIQSSGHEVENNTLSKANMDSYTYDQIYNELLLGKQTIENATNTTVKYVRTETVAFEDPVLKAARQSNHERFIGYSFFINDSYLDTKFKEPKDMRIYINRGAIIAIDLDRNERIDEMLKLLVPAVEEVQYQFVTIDELLKAELTKKPFNEIEGFDLAKIAEVETNQSYHLFEKGNSSKKQIALTIDDWGTDYTVTKMLDILADKGIKATFFIRANGAENNPGLARAMLEEGHEIANHTYSHPVITKITAEQLQDEIVRSHRILTEALQQAPSMYFRPPTGEIDDKTAKVVAATGYSEIALYDITTFDWDVNVSSEEIINIITTEASNGSIILLHMLDDIHTLEALPTVIDNLLKDGYTFVTMTEIMR
ncbi:polysaccharide deacetylase family protein [Paenibacillus endoradicis]|uniref:polysaccharide deacetylase family protein n=1 Tax=Paenibacillus endoradicis TaxID=2972487 RepID=UPI0021598396|nr:polysaccharide deacetylase family protein [Paenibacillus endoradicis]MCR8656984.1 polysaccharide deacetylase family protein [Paenibacillus endoradicis]